MNFVYTWPIVIVVGLILALSIVATEIGFRYGVRGAQADRAERSERDQYVFRPRGPGRRARTRVQMNAALSQLWTGVTNAVRTDPQLANASQIVPGAIEVMDMSDTREWAMLNRLPAAVVILLALGVVISGALVGHSSAEAGERHPAPAD